MSGRVVIAGAGPTGLVLALLLRHRRFEVQVFEASAEVDERPRAVMLHARGLEILHSLDLSDDLLRKGWWQSAIAFDRSDGLRLEMRFADLPSRFPGVLNVRQPDIERTLLTALREAGGVVVRGAVLRHCRQLGSGVLVEVSRPGRCDVLEADWVFGCDGARSTVRAALGSAFDGHTLDHPYLLGEGMPFSRPLAGDVSAMLISDHGVMSWLPFPDGSVRVAGPGRARPVDRAPSCRCPISCVSRSAWSQTPRCALSTYTGARTTVSILGSPASGDEGASGSQVMLPMCTRLPVVRPSTWGSQMLRPLRCG